MSRRRLPLTMVSISDVRDTPLAVADEIQGLGACVLGAVTAQRPLARDAGVERGAGSVGGTETCHLGDIFADQRFHGVDGGVGFGSPDNEDVGGDDAVLAELVVAVGVACDALPVDHEELGQEGLMELPACLGEERCAHALCSTTAAALRQRAICAPTARATGGGKAFPTCR